ncbi:hypothetical protein KIN20_022379 [Parelaphostrongylus tenuis]|uniref:Uncharacterized protein n=1 Tax=Parelaphostrongylus tenuis TaxID=148309 RepID=A0AAD5N8X8_PARTN|nr:hypothetical protein KIN20_022379 [Parelaphostrongylus tenuis]
MNQRYMRKCDMRLFLLRCPMSALPNSVFKPFLPIVKSFLLAHLYKFRRNRILYNNPPEFPSEDQLPHVINVLGPIDYLERNYPHLARVKREMIVNITHFTITYCLDWICEVLTLRSDQYGFVTYSYPVSDREEERDSHLSQEDEDFQRNGRGFPRKRKAERERFDYNDNRKRKKGSHFTRNGIPMDEPVATDTQSVNVEESDTAGPSSGISSTPINQLASRMDVEQQPASSQVGEIPTCGDNGLPIDSTIQDDWTEMLDTAFTDPNLPSNYKALIRGLVASNRELKNAITVMESEE